MASKNTPEPTPEPAVAATEETAVERPPVKEITGVEYIGRADVKRISAADLAKATGVTIDEDLEWSAVNGRVVPKTNLNAELLDWFASQPDFRIVT